MSTLNNAFQVLLQLSNVNGDNSIKNMAIIGVALLIIWKFRKQIVFALTAVIVFLFFFAREMILAIYPDTLSEEQKTIFTLVVGAILAFLATKNYMNKTK